ncbi:MAG: hypothetical protein WD577_04520 [Bacteroidales bacterium]
MKQIKYLLFILSLSLTMVFSGCESDPNGRMPDDIVDSNVGVIIVTESDPFINEANPDDYEVTMDVDLLFEGEFEKLDVVVVMNGDYENMYLLETITSVPQTITLTTQDLLDAIPSLNAASEIVNGNEFNVFTNITLTDGTYIPGYTEDGESTNAPSVSNIIGVLKGGSVNLNITVPCEFELAPFLGDKVVDEFWTPDLYTYGGVTVIEDPDYTGDDIGLIVQGLWDGTWDLKIILSLYDYSIRGNPDAQVMADFVFIPAYEDPTWSNITGFAETCEHTLTIYINSFCVSLGCFGGMPLTYTVYDAAGKADDGTGSSLIRTLRTVE